MVHAPPGTGKTTFVPPAVAGVVAGRVVVTQPRRIAARAAARRLAHLLGEPVGETVGYSVRGDRRSSDDTCRDRHDRSAAPADPARSRAGRRRGRGARRGARAPPRRRPDPGAAHRRPGEPARGPVPWWRCRRRSRPNGRPPCSAEVTIPMVPTISGAPVIRVPGALHPVHAVWCPPPRAGAGPTTGGSRRAFLDHVAATVRRALVEHEGDVLVFVPGVARGRGDRTPPCRRGRGRARPARASVRRRSRIVRSARARVDASSSRPRSPSRR